MKFEELKNGQKIKALDKIFMVNNGSIANNQDHEVYITETQITSGTGLTVIANIGDIGIWDIDASSIIFTRVNTEGELEEFPIYFEEEDYFDSDVNIEIFEILED